MINVKFKEDINVQGFNIKKGTFGRILDIDNKGINPRSCISKNIFVSSYDILELQNQIIGRNKKYSIDGLMISTQLKNVLIDAEWYTEEYEIYGWEIKKVLGFIPDTFEPEYEKYNFKFNIYRLWWLIEYLNDELREWVEKYGKFERVTEEMQEGDYSMFEIDDNVLINFDEFEEEREKLNEKLSSIGFYYNFNGGLILNE